MVPLLKGELSQKVLPRAEQNPEHEGETRTSVETSQREVVAREREVFKP
jgi:hypothetical protein